MAADEGNGTAAAGNDCRFEGIVREQSDNAGSSPLEPFPESDVFRPLLADPKQPQFFASWQATRARTDHSSVNIGSVGFGENFGLVGRRKGCDGWQVGVLAGVFAQFNLDAPSVDLINADYVIGLPVSWRSGLFSARVRLYHQSSHLGDEFLLGSPHFDRVNLSFEAIDAILSLDAPGGWGRIYGGGSTLVHRVPATIDGNGAQWGIELRGPAIAVPIMTRLRLVPVWRGLQKLRGASLGHQQQCRGRSGMVEGRRRPSCAVAGELLSRVRSLRPILRPKDRDGRRGAVFVVLICALYPWHLKAA